MITADKAHFGFQQIKVLGHVVHPGWIALDEEKLGAIRRLLEPTNQKQLRAFLGLVGFYRRFVKGFARIAHHLFLLLK